MNYLICRTRRYYFNRRVPRPVKPFDSRKSIRIALKTDCRRTALKLAIEYNNQLEDYWQSLIKTGNKHSETSYKMLVERARLLGFPYYHSPVVSSLPLEQFMTRLFHVEKQDCNKSHVEAVLGEMAPPQIMLDDAINRFFGFAKDKTINKSSNQVRKWRNPRIKAMNNLIRCIGNKPINDLTREDMLRFRDWWLARMEKEGLVSASANRDLIHSKTIITTVAENLKINIDLTHIFKKLTFSLDDSKKRLPFDSSHIISTLLNPDNLKGLNEQARWALYAFAETGAGLSELTGLLPEDIHLDCEIPYINIVPRSKKALKTKFRARTIPLVGYALDAFKACPNGFTNYADRPDSLSSLLASFLREHKLFPSDQHSVYSLRHSFQDRLLSVDTPDRIQADLMGHKFQRPSYGDGATLAHKLEWMKKIQLKPL